MLSFAAQFPLKSGTPADIIRSIGLWLMNSPHRVLDKADIKALENGDKNKIEAGDQTVELIRLDDNEQSGIGAKHTSVDGKIIYSTTIVGRKRSGETWVSVRTDRASLDPLISLREARKPQIIKLMLGQLGGGLDGELWVQDAPHTLAEGDESMAIRLLNGDSENHLPVVYLSRTFREELSCDPNALARHLGGLAHVVVEPNRSFSRTIQPSTNSRNAYGGAIGIYLPTGQRSLIIPVDEDEWTLRKSASETVREALLTRLSLPGFSWNDIEAEKSRRNIEALKKAGSTDLDAFVREFDTENQALREQNTALENEVRQLKIDLQNTNAIATGQSGNPKQVAIQDYFPGESEHFLKEAVEQALSGVLEGSRKEFVLREFAERLNSSPEMIDRKEKLKSVLSGTDGLDTKTRKALNELGFAISSDGKHHKLVYFGDERLTFAMAKTASDWRAGKNMASDISRKVY
ncbi:MAG: hypothetical protein CL954_03340 [Erythrobacteraceae bacterium]|nr:hypothetical protein [Erythrobacteraceae bacterium]